MRVMEDINVTSPSPTESNYDRAKDRNIHLLALPTASVNRSMWELLLSEIISQVTEEVRGSE